MIILKWIVRPKISIKRPLWLNTGLSEAPSLSVSISVSLDEKRCEAEWLKHELGESVLSFRGYFVVILLSSRCEVKRTSVRSAVSVGMNGEWHSEVPQIWDRLLSLVFQEGESCDFHWRWDIWLCTGNTSQRKTWKHTCWKLHDYLIICRNVMSV